MFPSVKSIIKNLRHTKKINWKASKYLSNGVYRAVFETPMDVEDFYLANMEYFNDEKVNTKCILNILLIYRKKDKKK